MVATAPPHHLPATLEASPSLVGLYQRPGSSAPGERPSIGRSVCGWRGQRARMTYESTLSASPADADRLAAAGQLTGEPPGPASHRDGRAFEAFAAAAGRGRPEVPEAPESPEDVAGARWRPDQRPRPVPPVPCGPAARSRHTNRLDPEPPAARDRRRSPRRTPRWSRNGGAAASRGRRRVAAVMTGAAAPSTAARCRD